MVYTVVRFDPIVPFGVWQDNMRRLSEMGKTNKMLGQRRIQNPNRYPIIMDCGDCGARLVGHNVSGKPVWKCSTYLNSNTTRCHPNWVHRDAVVVLSMEQIRRRVMTLGTRQRLEAEIRTLLDTTRTTRGETEGRLEERRRKLAELALQAKRALSVKINARDDGELAAASELYEQRRVEHATVEAEVRRLEAGG